jgi:hypothetical protein
VFQLPRSLSRIVRVLLTCVALAMAIPAAATALQGDISASIAVLKSSARSASSTQPRARAAHVRPQRAQAGDCENKQALTNANVSELRAFTQPAFLLNCTWLC